jgi:ABC-type transport system substrate-binding protein
MITQFSASQMISPTAYEKSGTTEDARKVWARANPVGTGPYKLVEYKRDAYITFTINPDYWRTGKPYIQNVTIKIIPDVMVSSALLQSGDATCWTSNANIMANAIDLEKKGFGVNYGAGAMTPCLFFNSLDQTKPWKDQRVRAAVEYAINRPQLASLIGYGKYVPMTQVSQPGSYSYNDGFDPRPYNVQKAKELLTAAGYPNGFKTTILTIARDKDTAAAIQGYLKAVGIEATLDVADTGRYYTIYNQGWAELCVAMLPMMRNSGEIVWQMGSKPTNFKASIYKSPEFLKLADQALLGATYEDIKPLMKQMVKQLSDDAMMVALYQIPYALIYLKSFHTTYLAEDGTFWRVWNDWTDDVK